LKTLEGDLEKRGSRLIVRCGVPAKVLAELIEEVSAVQVCWNRCYEPSAIERDKKLKQELTGRGIEVSSLNGGLLIEPWEIQTKSGGPYQVFTPFFKAVKERPVSEPISAPRKVPAPEVWPKSLSIDELKLLPRLPWDAGFYEHWSPGERGAKQGLERFLKKGVQEYREERDRPDCKGTSRLSPHLHFGEISPRQIWHSVCSAVGEDPDSPQVCEPYLRQLIWREFAHHLLYHFPRTVKDPLRSDFLRFPWKADPGGLRAWQRGATGYPIVDAGVRELWTTGWMHNRVRMIAASFLVKDLMIPWQAGAEWFWNTLVDADLANNTMGWQWVAGCGADAAPYFRIFNPVTQGRKFDPAGEYVRRWVPELSRLSAHSIHAPWEALPGELMEAGVSLGENYPERIVDHGEARNAALAALQRMKESGK
jgi:deoxyribodipyrimidine photo-lyase